MQISLTLLVSDGVLVNNGIHYMHHKQFTNVGISLFVGCSLIQVSVVVSAVKIPLLSSLGIMLVHSGCSKYILGTYSSFIQQLHMHEFYYFD